VKVILQGSRIVVPGVGEDGQATVRITTKDPFPALLENLAYGVYMGPPDTMQKQGADFFKQPVGTGPYKFVSWAPGEKLVVEATGAHFGGDPKIKTVVWQPVTEGSTRVAQLRTGEADLITSVSPTQLSQLEGQPGIGVTKLPSQSFLVLIMNSGRPPFNDPRVRQAMNFAVDKEAIIKTLLGGNGTVLPAPAGPAHEGYDKSLGVIYPYDPDKAKQLLTQAGLGSGFSITLDTPDGRYLQDKAIAEAIAGMLSKGRRTGESQSVRVGRIRQTARREDQRHFAHPAGRLDHRFTTADLLLVQDQGLAVAWLQQSGGGCAHRQGACDGQLRRTLQDVWAVDQTAPAGCPVGVSALSNQHFRRT
jgi:ABC-type oligopeptide transport system substrate-binding subunit